MEADLVQRKAELRARTRQALRSMDPGSRAEEGVAIRRSIRAWPTWAAARKASTLRTDYTFDARSQLTSITTYDGVDANGNGITANKSTTQLLFDAAGQLLQTIDARGNTTSTTYS